MKTLQELCNQFNCYAWKNRCEQIILTKDKPTFSFGVYEVPYNFNLEPESNYCVTYIGKYFIYDGNEVRENILYIPVTKGV